MPGEQVPLTLLVRPGVDGKLQLLIEELGHANAHKFEVTVH